MNGLPEVEVDHLVVAAADLQQGVAWCEATLGITPAPGGRHALMGTHNRLFSIAGAEFPRAYFEIIAIDPAAPPPAHARWFGLDDALVQQRIAQQPRLLHFVARSSAPQRHRDALLAAGIDAGAWVGAARDTPQCRLQWQMLLRRDGALACGGALPTLIHWQGPHPTEAMAASGVSLKSLALRGLPEPVRAGLPLRAVTHLPGPGPALQALLDTPLGAVLLES